MADTAVASSASVSAASASGLDLRGSLSPAVAHGLVALLEARPDSPRRPSVSPLNGSVLAEVPVSDAEDVRRAVERARAAQVEWAALPMAERAAVFLRLHDLILERQEQVLDVAQLETGKARMDAFAELADVALTARYYANSAARHLRPRRRQGAFPIVTSTVEHARPKGVVGIISPWNYPLTLAVSDAAPALLAGNGVVLKPDSQTPLTALMAVELLYEAGLPEDLFRVVYGAGSEIGTPLIESVDYVMFTGSTATGRIIAEQCARRMIGFSAELGGKNPLIVLDDADLERTVEGAARGAFSNSGQLCISVERMFVEDGIYDRFLPAFLERVQALRFGTDLGWESDLGSLVSVDQLARVSEHVDDAVTKGAHVLAGGRARPDVGPFFYEPTVLEGVTEDMTLCREETFGPVLAVYRVRDEAEAIDRANDSDYGLNASVWTTTPARGARVAAALRVGTVNINDGYSAAWASHDAPMGGMKDSGAGRRHGREGILKYTEPQTVAVQRLIPVGPTPGMSNEQFARIMTRSARVLRRLPFFR